MTPTLRPATLPDLLAIVGMMRLLQVDDPWSCAFEDEKASSAVETLLRDPSLGRIWLILCDDQPVGYIVLTFDFSLEYGGKCGWIDEFFIKSELRGKGLGAQVLELFSDAARELGAKTIHLEVNHGNRAIELYRRAGFEDHHRYLMTKWL